MAKPDVGAVADRLFRDFIAPLVIGGPMTPGRPIGPRVALAIGDDRPTTDVDKHSHMQLARVRIGRKLAAVDRFEPLCAAEWALLAALHDVVQTSHPELTGIFRSKLPRKLLDLVDATLEQIAAPGTVGEALSRHTLVSRMFEITRTDTVISWWLGSKEFRGEAPPERLSAWPKLRRVNVAQSPRPLMSLPQHGAGIDPDRFELAVRAFLSKSPLTDLATAGRDSPRFLWSAETLALTSTRAGRTLAVRALAAQPDERVDEELGRATKELMTQGRWKPAAMALDLLGERALAWAEGVLGASEPPAMSGQSGGAAFARAAGSFVARRWIAMHGDVFPAGERFALLRVLEPAASTSAAKELEELLRVATASLPAPAGQSAAPPGTGQGQVTVAGQPPPVSRG
jgi:hypothetical protein